MTNKSPRKPSRAATLADVGRAAGVSAMAASVVLNSARTSSRIAPATRKRILEAAARLGYRPNATARALAARRINTIGVAAIFYGGELNQYFLEVFNGILEAAARFNQNTTVFTLHDWQKDRQLLRRFCDGRIDGLILIAPVFGPDVVDELPHHSPFVSIHGNVRLPGVVNLESDEEVGAFTMVSHLISLGHRRIMHLSGPAGLLGTERRIRGYRRALAAAGIAFDETLVIGSRYDPASGRAAMSEWLRRHAGKVLPQAVFCANDGVAIGCLEALSQAGLHVPRDISVVGFDDTLPARTAVPQLTTVRQPLRALGSKAVETVLALIQSVESQTPASLPDSIVFPTELVIRASAGVPPPHPVMVRAVPAVGV